MDFKKHLPQIMALGSIVGVVTTAVIAVKRKEVYEELIREARQEHMEDFCLLQPSDKVKPFFKAYYPAIISGGLTISCIAGSYILSNKQQASLIGAYSVLEGYFERYRTSAKRVFGPDADDKIMTDMARCNPEFHQIKMDIPDKKCIFYEPYSDTHIVIYERELMDAEYHLNRNYTLGGHISLNDFYTMIGLPNIPNGDSLGWDMISGISWIDFYHKKIGNERDGTPIYSINTVYPPEPFEEY